MEIRIRNMMARDKDAVFEMMQAFYASPAVFTDGSDEIFLADIGVCLSDSPYLEGYVFEFSGEAHGYAMIAKSFSTEFGKPCIWIEDLYIQEEYRGVGIGRTFMNFIAEKYTNYIFRLEVEAENERAVRLYESCGFTTLPYMEMKK